MLPDYLHHLWQEKAEYIGADALGSLLEASAEAAEKYECAVRDGEVEFAIHAFLFGHGFHEDPRFPSVNALLTHGRRESAQVILSGLISAFDEYGARVLR